MKRTVEIASRLKNLTCCLAVLCCTACVEPFADSATDPLPLPPEIENNKDRSVQPGDSFYDYCNGSWLQSHPIPATGTIGGLYDADPAMEQRVDQLKANVPDIGRFYDLMEHMHERPEQSRAYLDAQRARFPNPSTREEAFLTIGRMIADGIPVWSNPLVSAWSLKWVNGKLVGLLTPPVDIPGLPTEVNPEKLVPVSRTKAGDNSAVSLIVQGMGLDPSQVVTNPALDLFWTLLEAKSLDEIYRYIEEAWDQYEIFVSQEAMERAGIQKEDALTLARGSLNYTLSYHLAEQFIPPALKERFIDISREIQASLRNRISQLDWMSETTRNNALEKLDNYGLFVAYPDEWHMDCISQLADCETLVEAVHRNNRNQTRLKFELIGGKDLFSYQLTQLTLDSDRHFTPTDLTLVNAMYVPSFNSVFIYPAMLLPPSMPASVSDAYAYASCVLIGHEYTHGFDTNGSQYDKDGNIRNWWTVADQMEFDARRQNIIQCYSHLELDPERAPGVFCDGDRTQTENIADLGGFLATLDAYKARLKEQGFFGQVYDDQIRKFYECYAHAWCVQYGPEKFSILQKSDIHSHARLRINGVVMNTDLWYDLFDVDRNNLLYLPPERRAYIW